MMFLVRHPMVFIFLDLFVRVSSRVDDFNTRNKVKLLKQGNWLATSGGRVPVVAICVLHT